MLLPETDKLVPIRESPPVFKRIHVFHIGKVRQYMLYLAHHFRTFDQQQFRLAMAENVAVILFRNVRVYRNGNGADLHHGHVHHVPFRTVGADNGNFILRGNPQFNQRISGHVRIMAIVRQAVFNPLAVIIFHGQGNGLVGLIRFVMLQNVKQSTYFHKSDVFFLRCKESGFAATGTKKWYHHGNLWAKTAYFG